MSIFLMETLVGLRTNHPVGPTGKIFASSPGRHTGQEEPRGLTTDITFPAKQRSLWKLAMASRMNLLVLAAGRWNLLASSPTQSV